MAQTEKINSLIEKLNNKISDPSIIDAESSIYNTFIIVGTPRSGTTIVNQIVGNSEKVTYPSNLVSRFWKNPVYGFALQEHLNLSIYSNFSSDYGRTKGISEPHEFSYFWRNCISIPDFSVPLKSLQAQEIKSSEEKLNACKNLLQKHLILKNFFIVGNLKKFKESAPSAIFVILKRSEMETCISMFKGQEEYMENKNQWMGIHPDWHELLQQDKMVRSIVQYRYINSLIQKDLKGLSKNDYIALDYEKIVDEGIEYVEKAFKPILDLKLSNNINESLNKKPKNQNNELENKYLLAIPEAEKICKAYGV